MSFQLTSILTLTLPYLKLNISELNDYELALIQYKKIDAKNSIEDMFALAKVFFKLGKYQQCFKSNEPSF